MDQIIPNNLVLFWPPPGPPCIAEQQLEKGEKKNQNSNPHGPPSLFICGYIF
jgi:hypothetical protein